MNLMLIQNEENIMPNESDNVMINECMNVNSWHKIYGYLYKSEMYLENFDIVTVCLAL